MVEEKIHSSTVWWNTGISATHRQRCTKTERLFNWFLLEKCLLRSAIKQNSCPEIIAGVCLYCKLSFPLQYILTCDKVFDFYFKCSLARLNSELSMVSVFMSTRDLVYLVKLGFKCLPIEMSCSVQGICTGLPDRITDLWETSTLLEQQLGTWSDRQCLSKQLNPFFNV